MSVTGLGQHPCALTSPSRPLLPSPAGGSHGGLGAGLEGSLLLPGGPFTSLIKAEATDPCFAQSFALNLQLLFWEGHLLTVTAVKWVQFSKWFL